MIKTKKTIDEYTKVCPHCEKELIGTSEDMVLWNLSVHIMSKHKNLIKKEKKR